MKTALCERLGIELPIIQAPMGGAVGPTIAAAVSTAGGLGMLSLSRADIETMRRQIRETRALTSWPFGVNLILEYPQEERLAACLDEGVPIISFFWRDPASLVPRQRQAGPSCCTRLVRRMTQREPWTAVLISLLPKGGKRAATCAAWWRQCRSFPGWWMPSGRHLWLPPAELRMDAGLRRFWRSVPQAPGSVLASLRATRPPFTADIGSFYCGRARPTRFILITCSMSAGRMHLTARLETKPSRPGRPQAVQHPANVRAKGR